ncbi:MAG TPA: hypothetical protein VE978_08570 [Chitinophagales bacterium]|nr:hypothetical protein [Chitinophagales bacterium]
MNRLQIITLLLFLTNSLLGQQSNLDEKLIKQNKVKEVVSTIHIYKTNLLPGMKEWEGKVQLEKYDSNGNLIYLLIFDTLEKPGLELWYQYDTYGNKIEEKGINHPDGSSDSLKYLLTYKDGKLLTEERSDTLFTTEYFYNSKGQLIRKNQQNKIRAAKYNTSPQEIPTTYLYDDRGNMTELFRLDGDFKIREFFKYDERNRKVEHKWIYVESETDTSGRIFLWEKYHYDKNGNLIQEENIGGYGGAPTVTYMYDRNGFLIKKDDGYSLIEYANDKYGNRIKETLKAGDKVVSETEYSYSFWK